MNLDSTNCGRVPATEIYVKTSTGESRREYVDALSISDNQFQAEFKDCMQMQHAAVFLFPITPYEPQHRIIEFWFPAELDVTYRVICTTPEPEVEISALEEATPTYSLSAHYEVSEERDSLTVDFSNRSIEQVDK